MNCQAHMKNTIGTMANFSSYCSHFTPTIFQIMTDRDTAGTHGYPDEVGIAVNTIVVRLRMNFYICAHLYSFLFSTLPFCYVFRF